MDFSFLLNPTVILGTVSVVHLTVHAFLPNSVWDTWLDGLRNFIGGKK